MDFGIPRNKSVNFHSKFGLGIPNHDNSGSKNLEIPRNSQKFQVLGIPTQRTDDFPWKAVNLKKFLGISGNFQEFLGMFKNYWEF